MNLEFKYLKCIMNELRRAMRIAPQVWLALAILGSFATASPASGETGPLTIENIECAGNEKTSCEYIVAQTKLRDGDLLEDEKVRESQLRLELLGYFDEVGIGLSKGTEIGKTKITITVKERSNYAFGLSTVFTTTPWALGYTDLIGMNRNFTGHGDTLSLRLQTQTYTSRFSGFHQNYLIRGEYTRSFLEFPRAYFAIGAAAGLTNVTPNADLRRLFGSDHIYRGQQWGDLALGYKLFDYSFVTVGYRLFFEGYPSSLFFQSGWDSQDNTSFPTQGSRFLISYQWYPGGSFFEETNLSVPFDVSYLKHWQLAEKHILSLRLANGGDQTGTDPAFRLYIGQAPISLRYTYQFQRHATSAFIQNGAVYIEPTVGDSRQLYLHPVGVKVGTTLETKYGLINLSFLTTAD